MKKNKPAKRNFETVFVQSEKTINLRVVCNLIIEKIKRGELTNNDKSKIR